MVDEKPAGEVDTKGLKKKLELLPDDDIADLSPIGVDAGTANDTVPKVACMDCELVGPYTQEDKTLKAKGKRHEVTFQIMRMTECGHGIVYGVMTAAVLAAVSDAKKFQARFLQLARAGDQSGAQRSYRKFETAIKRVKTRQRTAWTNNKNRTKLGAIPELTDAT